MTSVREIADQWRTDLWKEYLLQLTAIDQTAAFQKWRSTSVVWELSSDTAWHNSTVYIFRPLLVIDSVIILYGCTVLGRKRQRFCLRPFEPENPPPQSPGFWSSFLFPGQLHADVRQYSIALPNPQRFAFILGGHYLSLDVRTPRRERIRKCSGW